MEATERFADLMATPEPEVHADDVALLIAAHARPRLDVAEERERLDRIARGCPSPTLDGVRARLFDDLCFRGNRSDYHDPDNSYLDQVVRRRTGLPITLAVLTLGVARRVGVPLVGIGMPGHFLVGDQVDRDLYLDPFDGGHLLDATACERIFRALQGPDAAFHPSYLQPVGSHTIATRILANLRNVYISRNDQAALVWVLRLRTFVPGVPPGERFELATALAAVGAFSAAAEEMEVLAADATGRAADDHSRAASRLRAQLN